MDDWFHRGVLGDDLSDAQDDAHAELEWDELALDAAPEAFDDRFPGLTLASFFPSLHLNLAADLEKLGRHGAAAARTSLDALPDTPLGRMTRDAVEPLDQRLA